MVRHLKVITTYMLSLIIIISAFGIAVSLYDRMGRSTQAATNVKVSGRDQALSICLNTTIVDRNWRWVTNLPPSPDHQWYIYSTPQGVLCHSSTKRTLTHVISERELKRYGCVAAEYGLYCKGNSDPERHPRYSQIMGD